MATQPTPGPSTVPPPPPAPPATGTGPSPNRWMPVTAGILTIVAGVIDILRGLVRESHFAVFPRIGVGAGILWILLGILAVIGGAFACQKKAWAMALIGAICALLWPSTLLGILAIMFVALSKSEFK